METWYRINSYNIEIEPVLVVRSTTKTLVLAKTPNSRQRAELHITNCHRYFNNRLNALEYLHLRENKIKDDLNIKLLKCESNILKLAVDIMDTAIESL